MSRTQERSRDGGCKWFVFTVKQFLSPPTVVNFDTVAILGMKTSYM